MTLTATARLAPHFTAHELGADLPDIPASAEANLYITAAWLETARQILGVPLLVESGWRSPTHNLEVGGSKTSDHVRGLAADFRPIGLSRYNAYRRLRDSTTLPPFDQLIFYPVDGHIHVGLGDRRRGEYRLALAEGGYPLLTPALESKLRGAAGVALLVLLLVVLALSIRRKGGA
jgi:hypothetical protein